MKDKLLILLIDDDEDDHDIFNTAIKDAAINCQLHNAFTSEEALQILQIVTPDFIFLDMHMPRINGIEFLSKLKKMYSSFPFEVVMYSTGMTKELCKQATKIGATFCVRKPASLNELAKVLMQICIDKTTPSNYLFK